MNKKERVICAIEHKTPDRIPISDSFWEDTILRWEQEGLPKRISPREYFDFDICNLGLDVSPRFPAYLIEEDDKFIKFQDRFGFVAKKYKGKSRTLDFISYPVPDWKSWAEVKKMYVIKPNERARIDDVGFPFRLEIEPTWKEAKEKYQSFRKEGYYILANAYGPYESTWRVHGYTESLMDIVADPYLLKDIASTYTDLLICVINRCLEEGIVFDGFWMVDDIAANRGMLFSPDNWCLLYKPLVMKLGAFLKKKGIHFWMHCCGNAEAVFDDLIECGLQVIQPLQAVTGLDVCELKKKYGDSLTFYGNISAPMMSGSRKNIEEEIRRKLTAFKQGGGYIYHSDHSIPPEVSFERYKLIMKLVHKYGGCD